MKVYDIAGLILGNNNKSILLNGVDNWSELVDINSSLSHDKELIIHGINKREWGLWDIPSDFRNDKEIVLKAINIDHRNFTLCSKDLKNDKEFLTDAYLQNFECRHDIRRELENYPENELENYPQLQILKFCSELKDSFKNHVISELEKIRKK